LRILASIDQANTLDVVAKKSSGISVPADLIGKKIGVTLKLAPEYFLNQFLITNNILPSQVTFVDMPVASTQAAIIKGDVDAVAVPNPTAYNIKVALGTNAVSWSAQGPQSFAWFVISSDQFLKQHPAAATRFIKSLLLAEDFVKTQPEASKQIIEKRFSLTPDYFNQIWPRQQFSLTLDQASLIAMENEARWVIANKLTNQMVVPDYLNFIYFDALDQVKPEAITIIH